MRRVQRRHGFERAVAPARGLADSRDRADFASLHIDHALHPDSARWADHCVAFANALNLPDRNGCGDRRSTCRNRTRRRRAPCTLRGVRSASFVSGEILALAHHRDDQVETVLLKLLRGAGPEGLGGMREFRALGNGFLWRPLLDVPRSALSDYARDHRLTWIDDPSNADTNLRRNFLRNEILPRLTQRWSDASTAISHSASWMRAASDFIGDEARRALATMHGDDTNCLRWQLWLDLPVALRDAVLRLWLRALNLPAPAFFHVEELEKQLRHAAQDRAPCVSWPGCEIRRYRDCIYAMAPLVDVGDWEFEWRGGELVLPTGETLAVIANGKPLTWSHTLTVRNRRGGERLKPSGHAHHRDVRLLLAGIRHRTLATFENSDDFRRRRTHRCRRFVRERRRARMARRKSCADRLRRIRKFTRS